MKRCPICSKLHNETTSYCSKRCLRNNQKQSLTADDVQIALCGVFGDGCLTKTGTYHSLRLSSSKRDYMEFKLSRIRTLKSSGIKHRINHGYKVGSIYTLDTFSHAELSRIKESSIERNLNRLTELGLALWFYDDGSLHQKKHFYNLNTHQFSFEFNKDVLIPFFKSALDINGKVRFDRKKDGRCYPYLSFNRVSGNAVNIHLLLEKFPVKCYKYKRFGTTTIP